MFSKLFSRKTENNPSLKPGQVWTYHTRPGEENSRVIILSVDPHHGKNVVSISVENIALNTSNPVNPVSTRIGHMPFEEKTLLQSLIAKEAEGVALPDFQEGYNQWKQAFLAGKAGVWTLPVKETLDAMQQALSGNS